MKTKSHKICHGPVPFRYTEYVCSFDVFYLMFALSVDSDATPVDSRDPPVDSAFLRLIHSTLQLIFSQSGRFRDTPVDISPVRLIHSTLRLIFPLSSRFLSTPVDSLDTPVDISPLQSIRTTRQSISSQIRLVCMRFFLLTSCDKQSSGCV